MKPIALALIRAYQRWISPYKGFACAHRLHGGGASCSQAGFRLIRRHGLWKGLPLLRERLRRCGAIAASASQRPLAAQRGDCDLPDCSPQCLSCACDLANGCDWPRRDKRDQGRSRPR